MKTLNKEIEMIAYFENYKDKNNKEQTKVKPIRFRLTDEEHIERVFKIERITTQGEQRVNGQNFLVYTAKVVINDVQKMCQFQYCKETCKWTLTRLD